MITRAGVIYLASVAAHGALAIGIVALKGPKKFEDVSIAMVETKKKEKEKPKVDEPPPPPRDEPVKAKAAPPVAKAAPPAEAAPVAAEPAAASTPEFGLSLGGGGSGPGLAVRAAATAPVASAAPPPVHKVLAATPAASKCDEAPKKPRPISISQPAYTAEARAASITGRVRVEITVDEGGRVTKVRVLEGLGYGLDEAAMTSARAATFEPGTLCGKPTTATFTVAMRFTL